MNTARTEEEEGKMFVCNIIFNYGDTQTHALYLEPLKGKSVLLNYIIFGHAYTRARAFHSCDFPLLLDSGLSRPSRLALKARNRDQLTVVFFFFFVSPSTPFRLDEFFASFLLLLIARMKKISVLVCGSRDEKIEYQNSNVMATKHV